LSNSPLRLCATLVLAASVFATACSADTKAKVVPRSSTAEPATTSTQRPAKLTITKGATTATGTGGTHKLAAGDERAAHAVLRQYIEIALWAPISGQKISPNLPAIVSDSLRTYLSTHPKDSDVFTDRTSKLRADTMKAKVTLHAVFEPNGAPAAIAAEISERSSQGSVSTRRTGELLLRSRNSKWEIVGFELSVTRDTGSGAAPVTTTTKVAP
jgi:hypothetical protein